MLSATRKKLGKRLADLARCSSGNAALLVGLGMPVLIGGTGLAVDTAQWYMFKRELQLAADQGAIAGAWARAGGDTGTVYQTRAEQEFDGNISTTADFSPVDTATLEDYDSGTDNSVLVVATMQVSLPFTGIFMENATTISVSAQAIWENDAEYTACLMALHKTTGKALWFNGGPLVNAACGVASMSTASNSIRTNGSSGPQNINTVVAAGGIVDGMDAFANSSTREYYDGLDDPYDDLTPPDNPTARSLTCGSSTTTYTADKTVSTAYSYSYFKGKNSNQAKNRPVTYTGSFLKSPYTDTDSSVGDTYTTAPSSTPVTSTEVSDLYPVDGSGPDTIFERETKTITTTYSNIASTAASSGSQLPGTYSGFEISCDTTLSSGIYVIDGGKFKLNAGYELFGTGVMFVLKNGAELDINGTSATYLTPMSAEQLIAAGVSSTDAARMAGMLIFEDPDSEGSTGSKINGTADLDLNGVIYLPKSDLQFAGTAVSTAECLMVMSSTLQLSGTTDLTTLCPAGKTHDVVVGGGTARVRLVA